MEPQNSVAKPVMDIAAPRRPVSAPVPGVVAVAPAPAPMPAPAPSPALVAAEPMRPAPMAAEPEAAPMQAEETKPAARPEKQKPAKSGAPVALITVTILVMLLLSGIAVTIYLTAA